jgi:hypothetical protein
MEGVTYLLKTIDPDELPKIHYYLAGRALDLALTVTKALHHFAFVFFSKALKDHTTRSSQE